jgi:hypothetical protein
MNGQALKRQRGGPSRRNDAPLSWSGYGFTDSAGHTSRMLQLEDTMDETLALVPDLNLTAGDARLTDQPPYPLLLFDPPASFSLSGFANTGNWSPAWSSSQAEFAADFALSGSTTPSFPLINAPERWQDANDIIPGFLPAATLHDVGDVPAPPNGGFWSDTSLHGLGGDLHLAPLPVVNTPVFWLEEGGLWISPSFCPLR